MLSLNTYVASLIERNTTCWTRIQSLINQTCTAYILYHNFIIVYVWFLCVSAYFFLAMINLYPRPKSVSPYQNRPKTPHQTVQKPIFTIDYAPES